MSIQNGGKGGIGHKLRMRFPFQIRIAQTCVEMGRMRFGMIHPKLIKQADQMGPVALAVGTPGSSPKLWVFEPSLLN